MKKIILDSDQFNKTLGDLAERIIQEYGQYDNLAFIGIQRRGVDLARRLAAMIGKKTDTPIPTGSLDINLYRDDWTRLADRVPLVGKSDMGFSLDNRNIILVDDVLFSGRTVRAALEAIMDYGRPLAVRLLVLIDRGHRELPICADYAGKRLETEKNWHIDVFTKEHDKEDSVILWEK